MFPRPSVRALAAASLVVLISTSAAAAQRPAESAPAQQPAPAPAPAPPVVLANDQDARETRGDFEAVLKRLPPSVGRVMRIDPSLMRNPTYLAPYPTLAAFLQAHPEIAQNPGFYLEHVEYDFWYPRQPEDAKAQALRVWQNMMQGMALVVFFIVSASALVWIVRSLIDYRRWYRTSKVQTEVHTKLLDRLTSNEDLLAYMQTTPGRRFLESAPLPVGGGERPVAAPIGRILLSLQVGVVLSIAAIGLLTVSGNVMEELAQPLLALGVFVLALGVGFVVSAGASFLLSRRLGLLQPADAREHAGTPGA